MAVDVRRVFIRAPWEQIEGTLMERQTGPTNGSWLDPLAYYPLAITLDGAWTGTIFVVGVNRQERPKESEDPSRFPIIGDPGGVTSPLTLTTNEPYKWLKAYSTDLSSVDGVTVAFVSARPFGLRAF